MRETTNTANTVKDILYPRKSSSATTLPTPLQHGIENEARAIEAFCTNTNHHYIV